MTHLRLTLQERIIIGRALDNLFIDVENGVMEPDDFTCEELEELDLKWAVFQKQQGENQ